MRPRKSQDLSMENLRLFKTLLVLTNPPEVPKIELDKEGIIKPSVVVNEDISNYEPPDIKKHFHRIKTIKDLFPNSAEEEYAINFYNKLREDNLTGNRYRVFKKDSDVFNLREIKQKYKPRISKLKKEIAENERKKKEQKRKENKAKIIKISEEILSTEKHYVRSLQLFKTAYLAPMKNIVKPELHAMINKSLDKVLKVNILFLRNLENCYSSGEPKGIAELFIKEAGVFKIYVDYVNSYATIMGIINNLKKTDPTFQEFTNIVQLDLKKKGERATTIRSFLIMPVQRLPRYVLLLNDIRKKTEKQDPRYEKLCEAVSVTEKVAEFVNQKKKENENQFKIMELRAKYKVLKDIAEPHRRMISDNECEVDGKPGGFLYVFNDLFVIINKKGNVWKIEASDPDTRINLDADDTCKIKFETNRDVIVLKMEGKSITRELALKVNQIWNENQEYKFDRPLNTISSLIQREIYHGWLKKEGGGGRSRRLKKRWHILTGDKKMKYYSKKKGKYCGGYSLVGAKIGNYSKHKNGFFVISQRRTYFLRAPGSKEVSTWLEILEQIGCEKIQENELKGDL